MAPLALTRSPLNLVAKKAIGEAKQLGGSLGRGWPIQLELFPSPRDDYQ